MEEKLFVKGGLKIRYKILDLNIRDLEDFGKKNKGVYRIDILKSRVFWFDTVQDAARFNNYFLEIENDFSNKNYLLENDIFDVYGNKIKGFKNSRVLLDSIFIQSRLFNANIISENAAYLPRPIKNNKGEKFEDVDEAVEYLRKNNIAKGSRKIIKKSLIKNLENKTKKSYGMEWFYV